jgi:hypothetical protein
MGRMIAFDTGYQSVSAVQDLLELQLGTAQAAKLHRVKVMQSSLESPAVVEELQVNIKRATGSFTSGSGGGTATVVKYGQSVMQAHGLAATERNNTTQAVVGAGALETLEPGVFNTLAGEWEFTPTPELQPVLGPSEAVILSLDEAPAAARTLRAVVWLEILAG